MLMASRWPSQADRFRAARESFMLSLELGCTPAEAAAELQRRFAARRRAEGDRRMALLDARIAARNLADQAVITTQQHPPEPPRFWWQEQENSHG